MEGRIAWVIDFFYKESKSRKKKEKNIFVCFLCWGGGGGELLRDSFKKNWNLHIFFLGGGGLEWKG